QHLHEHDVPVGVADQEGLDLGDYHGVAPFVGTLTRFGSPSAHRLPAKGTSVPPRKGGTKEVRMINISELWESPSPQVWEQALGRYWDFVQPANRELEHALDSLDLSRIRRLDARGWYEFLLNEYFRWKYTAPNRYVTTTRSLRH